MSGKQEKILVHACCAACAGYLVRELDKRGYTPVLFYFNPNLNHLEYHYRLNGITDLAKIVKCELVVPEYDQGEYFALISPYQDKKSIKYINDPERFERKKRELANDLVLTNLNAEAKGQRITNVTTAMLCSPYRDHSTIWDTGQRLAEGGKLKFVYQDFRKGYWMGRNFARSHNLAIPAFCSDYLE